MAVDLGRETAGDEAGRLSKTLRWLGLGKLVLAALTLVLAFTGYDTARPVNVGGLFLGANLLMLGWVCLELSKAFGRASGVMPPPALADALDRTNKLFGYYFVLIVLAVLGVGVEAAMFLAKILGR